MRGPRWSLLLLAAWTTGAAAQEPMSPPADDRFWVRIDFLLWRVENDETPFPLITTGRAGDPRAGVLGAPDTSVFFGDQLDYRWNGGARLDFGRWLDDGHALGWQVRGFCLETHTIHGEFEANGLDGAPLIARPFGNLLTGQSDAHTITSPRDGLGGRYLGGIDVFGDSRTWSGEVNLLSCVGQSPLGQVQLVGGFRHLGQKDQLRFSQSSTVLIPGTVGFGGPSAPPPDIVSLRDYFETTNYYYGAQFGAERSWRRGRWTLDVGGTIGLGATDQRQEISGHTLLTDSTGLTQKLDGGLYATPDILGHHDRWDFAWTSEVNVRLGVLLTQRCQVHVGYTFLYWDGVVRPGGQLPLAIDPRQVPSNLSYTGPHAAIEPPFRSVDFWAQGLSIGLTLRF